MDITAAIDALGALAQETRLRVFRLLVEAGPEGLPAGKVARRLGVPSNTMSGHLGILARAGLVRQRREGRLIFCSADFAGLRALLEFLLRDCCGGRTADCAPLLDQLLATSFCPSAKPEDEAPAREPGRGRPRRHHPLLTPPSASTAACSASRPAW